MSASATTLDAKLPATTTIGAVEVTVLDIDRAVAFYQDVIGLRLNSRDDHSHRVAMGAGGRDVVVLVEEQTARRAGRHAGLYHYALLFESREEFANVVLRVVRAGVPVDGASDHGTHEALYLPDPDGNGIELAWDRPREHWPDYDQPHTSDPLDLQGLLAEVPSGEPRRHAGDKLGIGHVHLHVGDLEKSIAFYVDALGFELKTKYGDAAVFVAAGDYHHHLGFNLWRGRNADPAPGPATVAGLRHWTIELDDTQQLDAVRDRLRVAHYDYSYEQGALVAADPAGIQVRLVVPSS